MHKDEVKLGFTTIQHDPRLRYELTNNEYCIADAIYHLSHNPDSIAPGWCFARREKLGKFFGLSRRTVINAIAKLKERGLIEENKDTHYLRTTKLWYEDFILFALRKKEMHGV
ncbi:MAG TPA: helix-turn-helix domain-containing protein [Caldithrix sp.]|nr:helix-turn-helix domain-containing protein [Caldithrix sp.]